MTMQEQLTEIRHNYPDAWEYIMDQLDEKKREGFSEALSPSLPKFNDDDELISSN